MNKLRTLHIDAEKNWGGGERQVSGLCTYLRDQGHDVIIACRAGSKLDGWASENGFEAHHAPMKSTLDIGSVLRLRSIIRAEQPDIIHLHTSRAHVLGSAAAELAGAKVVIATRRMDDPIKMVWPNTNAYGRWTTAIVAISGAVRDVMIECGVDPAKIRQIESGTDVERFANAHPDPGLRESLGIRSGVSIICAAATLHPRKGIEYLIKAAVKLRESGREVHLLIAGDGPQREELESLAQDLHMPSTFVGFHPDVPSFLALSDVFVMASLTEGLGVAALEAMAAGKPVVASAVGGLKESVVDGETGFLVPPKDIDALYKALEKILSDPQMALDFGKTGRKRVKEKYSINGMAQRNEALYYDLLQQIDHA